MIAETDAEEADCLDRKLAASSAALAVVAGTVRSSLAGGSGAPDGASDVLDRFDKAERAFAAHAGASCLLEEAVAGNGSGAETACRIRLARQHAADLIRLMPHLARHWSDRIVHFRRAIAACVARSGKAAVRSVIAAGPTVRIRLGNVEGERVDCWFGRKDATVRKVAPVTGDEVLPDEGLAVFHSGKARPRPPRCSIVEPVVDSTGTMVGTLSFESC